MLQRYKESWYFVRGHWQSLVRLILLANLPVILAVGWFAPTEQDIASRFQLINQIAQSNQSSLQGIDQQQLLQQLQSAEPLFVPGLGILQTICWAFTITILTLFMYRVTLGEKVNESEVFRQSLKVLGMVAVATLLLNFLVFMGLQLLIVPGIWLLMKTAFVQFLIVEKRMTPFRAFRESLIMTRGIASQMFGGMVLSIIVGLVLFTFSAGLLGFLAFPARLMVVTTLMLLVMGFNLVFFYRYFCLVKDQPAQHQG